MRIEFQIARKYFFPRNRDFFRRISLISIMTVFLSVFLSLLVLGVLNGFHKSIENKLVSRDFHIQVTDRGDKLTDYKDLIHYIEKKYPDVRGFPFHKGAAIIVSNLHKTTIEIRGIKPSMMPFVKGFHIVSGKWGLSKNSVVIGSRLAKKLDVKLGDIVKFYIRPSQDEGEDVPAATIRRLKISGIFQSGYDEIDENLAFIQFKMAQKFYQYKDRAWAVGFFLSDLKNLEKIKKDIQNFSSRNYVLDWKERNFNVLASFQLEKVVMYVVLVLIIIATLVCVYIAFNVVVNDRKKEIGLLKTMGMKGWNIQKIFFLKGLIIGLIAILFGAFAAQLLLSYAKDLLWLFERGFGFYTNIKFVASDSTYAQNFSFQWGLFDLIAIFLMNLMAIVVATYFPVKKINQYSISESIRNV